MLDSLTKRRIDTARDILVGKVPDPKSQVEQITIALIYKFMDDMDREAQELGGTRTFFSGDHEKYAWNRIFSPRLGGDEVLKLYMEALEKLNINPNVPQLFRDIFKNAYLPYRDPETLKSFLKIIDEFSYDHSERLGDAFEYLLSVLGSQGSAGQFRTPRHIIDFMVEIIEPKKDDTILDPACGTAGFLISSYKHILKHNSTNFDREHDRPGFSEKVENISELTLNSKKYKGDRLTPDERNRLAGNITGYDISPDMVRLSLVNMYLHGLNNPNIFEYDTLTSEDRWNQYADVVLANPPFMSPKGGIRPHNRFSVESNRSEVLFVDYMAEHLTPRGRAAVIVPEGIIFQSGKAYKQLRKLLVEEYLIGVISLPAGVFNPYSGVKTSILWLDKTLAKKTDHILFVKVEHDGFDLGAQRRPIKENDLPTALQAILEYKASLKNGTQYLSEPYPGILVVEKSKIAGKDDFILSGERYKHPSEYKAKFELVAIGDSRYFQIESGGTPSSDVENYWNGDINWVTLIDLPAENFITNIVKSTRKISIEGLKNSSAKIISKDSVIVSTRATIGRIGINRIDLATNQGFKNIIIKDRAKIIPEFIAFMLTRLTDEMEVMATGGTFKELSKTSFSQLKIPLPPLSVQEEIVEEILGYQKIIDGARQVVENWKPQIEINQTWQMVELKDAPIQIIDGDRGVNYPSKEEFLKEGYCLYLNTKNVREHGFNFEETMFISKEKDENLRKGKLVRRDVVLTTRGTIGNAAIFDENVKYYQIRINSGMVVFRPNEEKIISEFLFYYFQSKNAKDQISSIISGTAQPQLPIRSLNYIKIPIPPINKQKEIVDHIIEEEKLIHSNRRIIEIYDQKIRDRIAEVWGEDRKYNLESGEVGMAAEAGG